MKERILLIEDDPQQSSSIKAAIERRYRDLEVEVLETESEFCDRLAVLRVQDPKPRMVICDVMLPWSFPDPDAPIAPADVQEGTFRKAGLRCWRRFRRHKHLESVPWIYFTVLDERTIEYEAHSDNRTGYAQKSSSIKPLLEEMEEYLHVDDDWTETDEQVTQRLLSSPKMRNILLDGLSAPISDCATSLP
jgi:DNA-binding NarL/FixJ family response regulator